MPRSTALETNVVTPFTDLGSTLPETMFFASSEVKLLAILIAMFLNALSGSVTADVRPEAKPLAIIFSVCETDKLAALAIAATLLAPV